MKRRTFLSVIAGLFAPAVPAIAARAPELAKFPRELLSCADGGPTCAVCAAARGVNPPLLYPYEPTDIDLEQLMDLRPGRVIYVRDTPFPMIVRRVPE